ncbi:MAG: hypothetical protein K8S54_15015 [Spirochaetia bacterium]|nr:hypothetical protein [Spirochaetia bacterium]
MKLKHAVAGILMLGFLASCRSTADSVSNAEEIEGWRVENEQDVFYMRLAGRASKLAIDQDSPAMMRSTCVDATGLQAQDNIIRKMIGETIQAQSGTLDGQSTGVIITSVRGGMIKGPQIKECAPTDKNKKFEECQCVHFVAGKGLKKKFELAVEAAAKK